MWHQPPPTIPGPCLLLSRCALSAPGLHACGSQAMTTCLTRAPACPLPMHPSRGRCRLQCLSQRADELPAVVVPYCLCTYGQAVAPRRHLGRFRIWCISSSVTEGRLTVLTTAETQDLGVLLGSAVHLGVVGWKSQYQGLTARGFTHSWVADV